MLCMDQAVDRKIGSLFATVGISGAAQYVVKGLTSHSPLHLAGKTRGKEAAHASTGCRAEVSISPRAFVPTISVASAAVAIRMAERWQRYEQYSPFWQVRPRVSARGLPFPMLQASTINCSSTAQTAVQSCSLFATSWTGATGRMLPWHR